MDQRLSVVTLGVSDLARARAFYEALGWRSDSKPEIDVVFFQAGGMVLALWARENVAEDNGLELGTGFGGVSLALNVGSESAVDEVLAEVAAAGATAVIQPGGSVRDQEVIDAANRLDLAMVFTGMRHFLH